MAWHVKSVTYIDIRPEAVVVAEKTAGKIRLEFFNFSGLFQKKFRTRPNLFAFRIFPHPIPPAGDFIRSHSND